MLILALHLVMDEVSGGMSVISSQNATAEHRRNSVHGCTLPLSEHRSWKGSIGDQSSAKEYATEAGGQSKWEHGSNMDFNAALNFVMFSTPIQFTSHVIVDQIILQTGESNTPSNQHHSTHEIAMLGSCPIFGHAHDISQYDPFCLMPCLFGIH